jgi:hypothetical protein
MRLQVYDKADEPRSTVSHTVKAQLELPQADPIRREKKALK